MTDDIGAASDPDGIGATGPDDTGVSGLDGIRAAGPDHIEVAGPDRIRAVGPDRIGAAGPDHIGVSGLDGIEAASPDPIRAASPDHIDVSNRRHLTVGEVVGIARIAFGGRVPEVREPGLFASAVHRPRARMFGTAAYTDLYEQAAALLHGLATNHPLVDGNKRTAWLAAATFLAVNGVDLAGADQDRAYDLVIDVASGAEGDVAVIAEALRGLAGQPV